MNIEMSIFYFNVSKPNLDIMIKHSVQKSRVLAIYRSINCDFMQLFESKFGPLEKKRAFIAKNSYVIYLNPKRITTKFMWINGSCKLCMQNKKFPWFKYIFIVEKRPSKEATTAQVKCIIKWTHRHSDEHQEDEFSEQDFIEEDLKSLTSQFSLI